MNERDLFAAIGETPENLLEASEKKPGKKWIIYLAATACLCLILAIALQYVHPPALPGQKISMEKIWWVQEPERYIYAKEDTSGCASDYYIGNQFAHLMSIEAKVLDVLPDVYAIPEQDSYLMHYYVLRVEVLETINGQNMPSQIYILLPWFLSTDLKQYDSLVMTVNQYGLEEYLLINTTKQRFEAFDFVFYPTLDMQYGHAPHEGAVLAFTDGVLDMSLWELDGWNSSDKIQYYLNPDRDSCYPARTGSTIEQVKSEILQELPHKQEKGARQKVYSKKDFNWPEAQSILKQTRSFDNGYYQVDFSNAHTSSALVRVRQFVNGFWAGASITISDYDQTIKEYGEWFTPQDVKKVPNLIPAIQKAPEATPPKLSHILDDGDPPAEYLGFRAYYYKTGDDIFGVVSVAWGAILDEPGHNWDPSVLDTPTAKWYGYTTILVYPDGSMKECTWAHVFELIEEYQNQ